MDAETIQARLAGLPIPQIRYYESIGSTNTEALDWAATGATDSCLVIADQQTQGRGRLGRHWVTQPGAALAFSLILSPTADERSRPGYFSPLGALAISQAVEDMLGLAPQVKWPNDVLLGGRKAAGILVETAWLGDQMKGVVIGIGLNVTQAAVPPADQLLFPATSVEEAAGRAVDRLDLLHAILHSLFAWRKQISLPAFRQAWEKRLAFRDQIVQIEETARSGSGGKFITGRVIGIDEAGSLVLRGADDKIITITTGDVRLRPAQ